MESIPLYEWTQYAESVMTELLASVPRLGPAFYRDHMQVCQSMPEFVDGVYWIVTICIRGATVS